MATSYLSYDVHTVTVTFRHASLEIGLLTLHCTSRYLHYSPIELMYNIGSSNQFGSIRTYSIRHLRPPLCPIARKTESPTTTPPALPSSKGPPLVEVSRPALFWKYFIMPASLVFFFPESSCAICFCQKTSYHCVGISPYTDNRLPRVYIGKCSSVCSCSTLFYHATMRQLPPRSRLLHACLLTSSTAYSYTTPLYKPTTNCTPIHHNASK